jgi:adenylate cyclase class IV
MAKVETELKFRVARPKLVRERLRRLGFHAGERIREINWIFDDEGGALRRRGRLLRLRQSGERWLRTIKGPWLPGALKRRPEAETAVADGRACRRGLELLGYRVQQIYRRHRTTFGRPGDAGEVAWDDTPLGTYLEIEGTAAWVRRTAGELGLGVEQAEPRSYPELYAANAATRRPKGRKSPAPARPSAAGKRPTARDDARRD